jgi:hypothetical protein
MKLDYLRMLVMSECSQNYHYKVVCNQLVNVVDDSQFVDVFQEEQGYSVRYS